MKIYRCLTCEEVVITRSDDKILKCCGEDMIELIPNSSDADAQQHTPLIRQIGNFITIKVGEPLHSMLDVHYIDFILLETDKGLYYKKLALDDEPIADFLINNQEKIVRAYAYCNNHFLWSSEEVIDGKVLLAKSA